MMTKHPSGFRCEMETTQWESMWVPQKQLRTAWLRKLETRVDRADYKAVDCKGKGLFSLLSTVFLLHDFHIERQEEIPTFALAPIFTIALGCCVARFTVQQLQLV